MVEFSQSLPLFSAFGDSNSHIIVFPFLNDGKKLVCDDGACQFSISTLDETLRNIKTPSLNDYIAKDAKVLFFGVDRKEAESVLKANGSEGFIVWVHELSRQNYDCFTYSGRLRCTPVVHKARIDFYMMTLAKEGKFVSIPKESADKLASMVVGSDFIKISCTPAFVSIEKGILKTSSKTMRLVNSPDLSEPKVPDESDLRVRVGYEQLMCRYRFSIHCSMTLSEPVSLKELFRYTELAFDADYAADDRTIIRFMEENFGHASGVPSPLRLYYTVENRWLETALPIYSYSHKAFKCDFGTYAEAVEEYNKVVSALKVSNKNI